MTGANTPAAAMVLAAGLGTRMRPLTLKMPKPLVPVANKPLLDYVLKPLLQAQLKTIVINTHHFADQMHTYVKSLAEPSITVSDESEALLDSGGGIKKALPLLGSEPFYILNADSFWIEKTPSNLQRLADFWDPHRMDLLLLLATPSQATGYDGAGDFERGDDNRLQFRHPETTAPFIYAGCGLMKPELFHQTPDGPFSLSTLFRQAAADGTLFGLELNGAWMHVGTVAAIAETEQRLYEARI
jgi:N-acetyl-alpha-D-muramate 1-phosphate uridylyltransferase